ncbi:hypothetical protein [Litorihabitans aurantiacus]|uniref:Uncharacterized protein n=1 Tax=Litorihabitans aurantiacus TaxID=1930061 RepID=A0AA37UQZ3_9MICO|nr:hypothetical protein [Litorihabitans aurantiacus]GMA30020.1 hypothetical protein GCM10025875_00120 [Litorihabitans aurantiacus]
MTGRTAVSTVRHLGPDDVEAWWPVYEAAFAPMATRAAARHLLTRDEFAEEMGDDRILKLLARDEGRAVAMTTIATDVSAVPWISPDYYRAKHPEALARNALWYVGYTLAHPSERRTTAFVDMLDALIDMLADGRVTVGYDVSRFNDLSHHFADHLFRRARRVSDLTADEVDVQTYYTATFSRRR